MNSESPFTLSRFEHEREHLYFLPPEPFSTLEDFKPTYLVGSRGTGKTTLLQALSWSERLASSSLQQQLGRDVFAHKYIGVYLKLPKFDLGRIEHWAHRNNENEVGTILAFYLDLIWVELVIEAVTELLLLKVFKGDPAAEHELVRMIMESCPELKLNVSQEPPITMKTLRGVVYRLRREIETVARSKSESIDWLQNLIPTQVGQFGRQVAKPLADFCNKHTGSDSSKWHFKIAMDEAECLTTFQQKVVNTAVRLAEQPISFVVSYVSLPEDPNSTLVHGLTLQKADRHLLVLDNVSDKAFRELAEGVATVRVRYKLRNKRARFDSGRLLGKLNIDALIEDILKKSVSPKARVLAEKAKELRSTPFFAETLGAEEKGGRNIGRKLPPFYKAYIIDRLSLEIPSPGQQRWQRRKQDSAELRKRMAAAYLSICKEFADRPNYAFAEMVLQMSDNCIRDFLSQLHEIFEESAVSLKPFLRRRIPIARQDNALKRASKQKRDSIPRSGVVSIVEVGRLIEGLGQITEILQTNGPNYAHLRSPDRGRFKLDTRTANGESNDILKLVSEAAEAGFIRIVNQDEPFWEFQVHCSLAAGYGFSYRGAYYSTPIGFKDLRVLSRLTHSMDRETFINQLGARLAGEIEDPAQMRLF